MSKAKGNGDYVKKLTGKEIEQFKKVYDAKKNKDKKKTK